MSRPTIQGLCLSPGLHLYREIPRLAGEGLKPFFIVSAKAVTSRTLHPVPGKGLLAGRVSGLQCAPRLGRASTSCSPLRLQLLPAQRGLSRAAVCMTRGPPQSVGFIPCWRGISECW
jgi:hypothetical protein